MREHKRSFVPGIVLIGIGIWFLIRRFYYFSPDWIKIYPFLLLLFSFMLLFEAFRRHHTRSVFWGIVFLISGVFFMLRNYDFIPYYYAEEYWPLFLVAAGCGYIGKFILEPAEWDHLIPAGIFILLGIGFSIGAFFDQFWKMEMVFEKFWPLLIVVAGVLVLLRGLRNKTD